MEIRHIDRTHALLSETFANRFPVGRFCAVLLVAVRRQALASRQFCAPFRLPSRAALLQVREKVEEDAEALGLAGAFLAENANALVLILVDEIAVREVGKPKAAAGTISFNSSLNN